MSGIFNLGLHRTLSKRFLTQSCTIKRPTDINTSSGQTRSYGDIATNVDCRVSPLRESPEERAIASSIKSDELVVVTLPYEQDVAPRDRIVVTGRVLEVIKPLKRSIEAVIRVVCIDVR